MFILCYIILQFNLFKLFYFIYLLNIRLCYVLNNSHLISEGGASIFFNIFFVARLLTYLVILTYYYICFVWAHHMFVAGIVEESRLYFSSTTIITAIPTAMKIFTWLSSLYSLRVCACDIFFSHFIYNMLYNRRFYRYYFK